MLYRVVVYRAGHIGQIGKYQGALPDIDGGVTIVGGNNNGLPLVDRGQNQIIHPHIPGILCIEVPGFLQNIQSSPLDYLIDFRIGVGFPGIPAVVMAGSFFALSIDLPGHNNRNIIAEIVAFQQLLVLRIGNSPIHIVEGFPLRQMVLICQKAPHFSRCLSAVAVAFQQGAQRHHMVVFI